MPDRKKMRELAAEYVLRGDQLGWFDRLYQEAANGKAEVPWADGVANPGLLEFWQKHPVETAKKTALVIGSGFGDDSEQLAKWGFRTTGFDISPTAIRTAKRRYPHSKVEYVVRDLFHPPAHWLRAFDFVLEIYTVQSFSGELRARAVEAIAGLVAPGGHLLAIARAREVKEPMAEGPPWPLTREEMEGFRRAGLEEESFESYADSEPPWVGRFRGLYRRP